MYKNVLVPVAMDHNTHLAEALAIAGQLKAEGTNVHLLHVMESIPAYVAAQIPEDVQEGNLQKARDALAEMGADANLGAEVHLVSGHSGRTIIDFANTHDADLIIIASHRPGLQDYFLGSTAAHVVRHARCSVHVIR